MKAVGYIRVSSEMQIETGHSLDAQRTIITDDVRAKGWTLGNVFRDPGLSGALGNRPALQALMAQAERDEFEVVIVHAIDRRVAYRDLGGLLATLHFLQQHHVTFVSITENLDLTTPWGKLVLAVLGALAEIYIDKLREETKKGKQTRRSQRAVERHALRSLRQLQWVVCGLHRGRFYYPHAPALLILADGGGSNGYRTRLWKYTLQHGLVNPHGLEVTVTHYPTGASKWNPADHRLFSFISGNWAGQPLTSYDKMLGLIEATTTEPGLVVKATLTRKVYLTKIKISNEQMGALNLQKHTTLPQWNYTLKPQVKNR